MIMQIKRAIFALLASALAGCAGLPVMSPPQGVGGAAQLSRLPPAIAAQNFITVVDQIEPLAEQICAQSGRVANCDFQIVVDSRPSPPNAFQTLDETGRPIIGFTLSLIATAQNRDELAFILGHEAGHHIAGHIARAQQSAVQGAVLAGVLAQISGANRADIDRAAEMGAGLAARRYSKEFELEADLIGTRIAFAAGYDPVLGAAFFDRLPDPGDRFLGTHPANANRKALVQRETARLRNAR
jgi:predicted Zn-dependent protease